MDSTAKDSAWGGIFTRETLIVEAEERIDWDALSAFYKEQGIKCLLCPAAVAETFEQGAKLHKFDVEKHLAGLNELLAKHPRTSDKSPGGFAGRVMAWLVGRVKDKPAEKTEG